MKVDLHMHTNHSPDSEMSPESLVSRCSQVGLDCIAVTDHNTVDGAFEVKQLASFRVIIGEEIRSSEGEITGLFLQDSIPKGLTPVETVRRIKEQGGLVSLPHPFDRFRRGVISPTGIADIITHVDIVEVFNSRNNLQADNRKAHEFASQNKLLMSGVSDAHTTMELGRTYVEMPEFDGTAEGFKYALSHGEISGRGMTPLIHVLTTFTKIKKRIKKRFMG